VSYLAQVGRTISNPSVALPLVLCFVTATVCLVTVIREKRLRRDAKAMRAERMVHLPALGTEDHQRRYSRAYDRAKSMVQKRAKKLSSVSKHTKSHIRFMARIYPEAPRVMDRVTDKSSRIDEESGRSSATELDEEEIADLMPFRQMLEELPSHATRLYVPSLTQKVLTAIASDAATRYIPELPPKQRSLSWLSRAPRTSRNVVQVT